MLSTKPAGRGASARKYDILTALGVFALSQGKHEQRRALRLITLVTARYNWARDELAVGQREIAQLWSVDMRTVKREMALFRAKGWLRVKRQGARGRVTEYGLDLDRLLTDTKACWPCVGSDFELRMGQGDMDNDRIVPLPLRKAGLAPETAAGTEWALASALLHAEDAGTYASWLAALKRVERVGGRLTLRAPTRFHAAYVQTHLSARVLLACRDADAEVSEIRIVT
ncbi:MAG: hypothetical protein AAF636_08710 [Pseudomonadota bacterium]